MVPYTLFLGRIMLIILKEMNMMFYRHRSHHPYHEHDEGSMKALDMSLFTTPKKDVFIPEVLQKKQL